MEELSMKVHQEMLPSWKIISVKLKPKMPTCQNVAMTEIGTKLYHVDTSRKKILMFLIRIVPKTGKKVENLPIQSVK